MLRDITTKLLAFIKSHLATVGVMITLGGLGYSFHRVSDLADGYAHIEREGARRDRELADLEARLLRDIHQKELTCKSLEHQVKYASMSYKYCKEVDYGNR